MMVANSRQPHRDIGDSQEEIVLPTGFEVAVLIVFLVGCGVTVALVIMTLKGDAKARHDQDMTSMAPLGGEEQTAELVVDLCDPMVFEPIGKRDRDQAERQYQ